MDDLRARIAQRKRERKRKARIRLIVFATIVAAIILAICFSCENNSTELPSEINTETAIDTSPSHDNSVEQATDTTIVQ